MKEAGKRLAECNPQGRKRKTGSGQPRSMEAQVPPDASGGAGSMTPTDWFRETAFIMFFFQYSPFDVNGKDKFWGHYASRDLLNWQYLGTPFVTDEDFDRNGVYSGCAYAENGKLYGVLYGECEAGRRTTIIF